MIQVPRTQRAPDFLAEQRVTLIRELERSRVEGVALLASLMRGVDARSINEVWPVIGPVVEMIIAAQQAQGRRLALGYASALGIAMGLGLVRAREPWSSSRRDGLLPSGLPAARLVQAAPFAVKHRIELGQPAPVALQHTLSSIVRAVNEAAHAEARDIATDILKDKTIDFQQVVEDTVARNRLAMPDVTAREPAPVVDMTARRGWFGEQTITRYIRVPSVGACGFCLMLGTRSSKSGSAFFHESFGGSNKRFTGRGTARVHANCRCVLMPETVLSNYSGVTLDDPSQYTQVVWKGTTYTRKHDLSRIVTAANAA